VLLEAIIDYGQTERFDLWRFL